MATSNVDRIQDFVVADDTIQLQDSVYTRAGPVGTLSAEAFHIGARAQEADDRIIYDTTSGALYYDRDGSGSATQVKFAQLSRGLGLTNEDFSIV
jgi:Ca2+-binding RTX toxin-like protein